MMTEREQLSVDRCAALVDAAERDGGWGLSPAERARYALALADLATRGAGEAQLRRAAEYYHLDHALVESLRDRAHQRHDAAWAQLARQVVAFLRSSGLGWAGEGALDEEDLVQLVQVEVFRSLDSYRYGSRFSTWVYQVMVRTARRVARDSRAGKRAGRTVPIERAALAEPPDSERDHPEQVSHARQLAERVDGILIESGGERLSRMFRMWALGDLTSEQIGERVRLHPSRVRVLLVRARQVLAEHPDIVAWRDAEDRSGR